MEVIFKKIPKNGRKIFTRSLLNRKPMSLLEADQAVKTYAKGMPNSASAISFKIMNDDMDMIFSTEIKQEDADQGIIALIRRDSEQATLDSTEQEQVEELISAVNDDLDGFIDEEDEEPDEDESNTSSEDFSPSDTQLNDDKQVIKNQETVITETSVSTAPDEVSQDITNNQGIVSSEQPVAALPGETKAQSHKNKVLKLDELYPYDQYTDPKDIYARMPANYGVNEFATENIKHDLGFKSDPVNKYEEELNQVINNSLQTNGITDIQSDYDEKLAKLKAEIVEELSTKYSEINQVSVDEIVTENLTEDYRKLETAADQQKKANSEAIQKQEANEKARQKKADEIKLADYKERLAKQREISLTTYNEKVEADGHKQVALIDKQLAADKESKRKLEHDHQVKNYNTELRNRRSDLGNHFDLKIRENYDQHNTDFTNGLKLALDEIKKEKRRITQEQRDDIAAAKREKALEIQRQQKAEELRLKKRELDQQQKFNDLNYKAIKEMPEAIKEALAGQRPINVQVDQAPHEPGKSAVEIKPAPPAAIKGELVETGSRDLVSEQSNKKQSKKQRWLERVVEVMVIAVLTGLSGAFLGSFLFSDDSTPANNSTEVLKTKHGKKTKNITEGKGAIKSKRDSNPAFIAPRNKEAAKNRKALNDVQKYRQLDGWAAKRDFLNGLLGQKDVRSLHQIATRNPSKVAELYYVITNEDKERTRAVWLSMNTAERREIVTAAKQAVTLAFYDIADWNNGWLASYAY